MTISKIRILLLSVVTVSLGTAGLMPGNAYAAPINNSYLKITEASTGRSRRVKLGLNKSLVVDLPADAHDILVANPNVADAVTRTSRRIYLFGKEIGQTNIFVFDGEGKQMLNLDIEIERDINGLVDTIERLVPNSEVNVEMINDNIVLTGAVPTPQASAKAARIAEIFVSGGQATQNQGQGAQGAAPAGAGLNLLLGGEERTSQIVNLLKIEGEDQVQLKVVIAEIHRSIVKQLGINTDLVGNGAGNFRFSNTGDNPFTLGKFASNALTSVSSPFGSLGSVTSQIRALEQAGVMKTLASPTLTAISGEKASFSVGGEYPLPDGRTITPAQFDGTTGRQTSAAQSESNFRTIEYGISLDFTPVVLTPGRISLKIRTEVSEPTSEGAFTLGGGGGFASFTIPGVRRRMADTTVELPSGGSMVIAGLVRDDVRQTISGYPGLSKIPIFGTLFRSRGYQKYETELVIIVTPYLVRPVARRKLARPDENFAAASDSAGYFMGRVNRVYGTKQGNLPKGRYNGSIGFIFK